MTDEHLKLLFDNQRIIMQSLTYLILLESKQRGAEVANKEIEDLKAQWIETTRALAETVG